MLRIGTRCAFAESKAFPLAPKKKHPEHENLERWLVSYADFITLLFATFTALYAIATAELADFKDFAEAIKEGFQQQSIFNGMPSVFEGQGSPSDSSSIWIKEQGKGEGVIGQYESLTYTKGELKTLNELVEELTEAAGSANKELAEGDYVMLGPSPDSGNGLGPDESKGATNGPGLQENKPGVVQGVEIAVQERGLRISFDTSLLFAPGTAELQPRSLKILDTIAERLKEATKTNLIYIEGHTDNQPIRSALFPSNWELSTARASAVVRRLINAHGFNPEYLVAVGYGDTRPIAQNTTPAGRAKNRRIDIIIHSRSQALKADSGKQMRREATILKGPLVDNTLDGSGKDNGVALEVPKEKSSAFRAKKAVKSTKTELPKSTPHGKETPSQKAGFSIKLPEGAPVPDVESLKGPNPPEKAATGPVVKVVTPKGGVPVKFVEEGLVASPPPQGSKNTEAAKASE